jgi:glucose/mannose transport system permease protein
MESASETAAPRTSQARPRRRISRDRWISLALITPSILAIAVFVYGFIGWTGFISLTKWADLLPDYRWNGLANYVRLFANDERFRQTLLNNTIFTIFFISACLGLGLLLAIILDRKIRGEGLFRTIFLFPMAVSFIVTGVVWRWILNPGTADRVTGINQLFDNAGLGFLKWDWFLDRQWGILAVVLAAVWQMSGYTMAMFLAGLRAIPDDLREAARVDGASESDVLWYITLPLLKPILVSSVIILGHISLKIFDLTSAMKVGGASKPGDVPGFYMYETTFRGNNFARGAAIAIIMLVFVAVLIIPYLISTFRSEAEA